MIADAEGSVKFMHDEGDRNKSRKQGLDLANRPRCCEFFVVLEDGSIVGEAADNITDGLQRVRRQPFYAMLADRDGNIYSHNKPAINGSDRRSTLAAERMKKTMAKLREIPR